MNQAEAKALCVTKWEYIVGNSGNPGGLYETYPQLNDYINGCAYCNLYIASQGAGFKSCRKCPIRVSSSSYKDSRVGCEQDGHPYKAWNRSKTTANAQVLLNLINAT